MSSSIAPPSGMAPAEFETPLEQRPARFGALAIATLLLCTAGLGIALYLTYVHYAHAIPICLPGGGCEAVNSSIYSTVGPVPVALLGAGMYVALFALTVASRRSEDWSQPALLARFGVALAGASYSAYLTYVAVKLVQATCIWCLTSFSVVTLVTLVSLWELVRPPVLESQ